MNIWPFKQLKHKKKRQQDLAWIARAAFERGYKSGGGEWRDDWKKTPERETLVRWGYIMEDETWR